MAALETFLALPEGSSGWWPPMRDGLTDLLARVNAVPLTLTGTYAARPAATTVPTGTMYYPTNIPEMYRSTGLVWQVIGSGGSELGYAQSTAAYSNATSTPADIAGLTTTFVAGERPIEVRLDGDITHSVAGGVVVTYLLIGSTTYVRPNAAIPAAGKWQTISRRVRVSGLTPGASYTAKAQIAAVSGTGQIQGDATNPMSVSVVTL